MSRPTRYDAVVPIRFRDADDFMVQFTQNISTGGMYIRTASPPPVGTVLKLSLELPGSQTAVPSEATVVLADENGIAVRFSKMDPAAAQVLQTYVEGLQRKSRGHVVIIDDDPDIVEYLTTLLRKNHFTVVPCSTPNDVFQACQYESIDVVLSDLYMPAKSGPQIRAELLQQHPETATIPWILMTSSQDETHEQKSKEMGFYSFLNKPIQRDQLVEILSDALIRKPKKQPPAPASDEMRQVGIVNGAIDFKYMKLCNVVSGAPIERARVRAVDADKVAITDPAHLAHLPHIVVEGMPDQIAFEAQVVRSYHARVAWLGRGKGLLAKFGVPATVSEAGFCVIGQVAVGGNNVVLSVRDEETLAIEAIGGVPFTKTGNPSDALVDISRVTSGIELQRAVQAVLQGPPAAQPEQVPVQHAPLEEESADNLFGTMDELMGEVAEPAPPPPPMNLLEESELDAVVRSAGGDNFDESFFENVEAPEAFSLMCSICGDHYELNTGTDDQSAYVACESCR